MLAACRRRGHTRFDPASDMKLGREPLCYSRLLARRLIWVSGVFVSTLMMADDSLNVERSELISSNHSHVSKTISEFADGSHWQLGATELQRAQMLHREFRQYVSDRRISPLEVLGIHARTDAERRRYARQWAKLMVEDAERTLAFQLAYDQAMVDIVHARPLIDVSKLPPRAPPIDEIMASDRLALFTKSGCAVCDEVLKRVMNAANVVAGIDIYVLALPETQDAALQRWASQRRIPPLAVRSKRITLNFDKGLLEQLNPRITQLPVVMRRRGDRFEVIDPWVL